MVRGLRTRQPFGVIENPLVDAVDTLVRLIDVAAQHAQLEPDRGPRAAGAERARDDGIKIFREHYRSARAAAATMTNPRIASVAQAATASGQSVGAGSPSSATT